MFKRDHVQLRYERGLAMIAPRLKEWEFAYERLKAREEDFSLKATKIASALLTIENEKAIKEVSDEEVAEATDSSAEVISEAKKACAAHIAEELEVMLLKMTKRLYEMETELTDCKASFEELRRWLGE